MELKNEEYQNFLKNRGMIFYHDQNGKLNMLNISSSNATDTIISNIDRILKTH